MTAIQILGITDSLKMRLLRANVEEAIRQLGITNGAIQEISEIDQLMQYNIVGIPALVVGKRVLFQQMVPEVETIKAELARVLAHPDQSPNGSENGLHFE